MKILTKEQILLLHSQLVKEFGGSLDIRDDSLLESAINTPFQTYGGYLSNIHYLQPGCNVCFRLY